jgi:hypothetical protein
MLYFVQVEGEKMKRRYVYLVMIAIMLQACSTPVTPTSVAVTEPASQASTETQASTDASPSATTDIPTPNTVSHETFPTTGITDRATAHDNDNALTFEKKVVRSGDEFFRNRFERPFTSGDMNYLPDLDIVNFSIISDDTFFYIKISFVGLDTQTQTLTGSYGVEIDRNGDGRAEILLVTHGPYTEDFSADNVAVYLDMNSDVGGSRINRPDDFKSDGFETVIFDLSRNVYPEGDPDLAWVRQTTDGSLPAVEIAYKKWIFKDGKEAFMWSADASGTMIDPTQLYVQDFMTAEEAGAANNEDPNYPIKALAAFDNTCRVPLGFTATGNEPLGCFVKSSDSEKVKDPSNEGPDSTCGQFAEVCMRTESSRIPFIK